MTNFPNFVFIKGNITREPEYRQSNSGSICAAFSIAWNRSYKTQEDTYEEEANYFDVSVWMSEKQHQYMQTKFVKGAAVALSGTLRQDRWQDNEGNNRSKVYILVNEPFGQITVEERNQKPRTTHLSEPQRPQPPQAPKTKAPRPPQPQLDAVYDEDIPF